jgi:hypothetical protein
MQWQAYNIAWCIAPRADGKIVCSGSTLSGEQYGWTAVCDDTPQNREKLYAISYELTPRIVRAALQSLEGYETDKRTEKLYAEDIAELARPLPPPEIPGSTFGEHLDKLMEWHNQKR